MNFQVILQVAGALVLVGGAVAVIIKVGKWMISTLKKINEFLEDWRGEDERPGYPRRKGVLERLVDLEHEMGKVVHEVQPNSGNSLKDKVNRIGEHILPKDPTV